MPDLDEEYLQEFPKREPVLKLQGRAVSGSFEFGLLSWELDGRIERPANGSSRIIASFDGMDEMHPATCILLAEMTPEAAMKGEFRVPPRRNLQLLRATCQERLAQAARDTAHPSETGAPEMILEPSERERLFRISWPLLHFTNQELQIFPKLTTAPSDRPPSTMEAAHRIRTALWKDPVILQRFTKENPYALPAEDLAVAASWEHRVEGTFFVFRHLKRHTILIDESDPPRAFAVHGLTDPISAILGPDLPVAVQAVLLPFEEKIVYDGLLAPYPVIFGSGIRHSLKEAYDRIRERDAVIASLPPKDRPSKPDGAAIPRRNSKLLDVFRRYSYLAGRTSATVERDVAVVLVLASEMSRSDPSRGLIDVAAADIPACVPSGKSDSRSSAHSLSRFARFLAETGRTEPEVARALLAVASGGAVRPAQRRRRDAVRP